MRNIADVNINTKKIANDINRFYISYLGTDNDPLGGLAYTNKQVRRPRPALLQFSHCIHFFFQIIKQCQHLFLNRYIKRRRWFIRNQQIRLSR